jgi:hypothetical protein
LKRAIFTNKHGWKYVRLVRDGDSEEAAESGIPVGPPDLNKLDWEGAKKDINNLLVDRDLLTYKDLQRAYTGLASAVAKPIMKRLIQIYKNETYKESNNE